MPLHTEVTKVQGVLVAVEHDDPRHFEVFLEPEHRRIGKVVATHNGRWRVAGHSDWRQFGSRKGAVTALVTQ